MNLQIFSAWRNWKTRGLRRSRIPVRQLTAHAGSSPAALKTLPIRDDGFAHSRPRNLLPSSRGQWANGACTRRPEAGEKCSSSAGILGSGLI